MTEQYRIPDSVRYLETGEGGVLLDLDTNRYHRVNRTGARVWEGLQDGSPPEQVVSETATDNNNESVLDDIQSFVAQLLEEGLLERCHDSDRMG